MTGAQTPPRAINPIDRSFLDSFISLGLTQWVYEPTYPRSGNILDIVLTTEPDRIGLLEVLPPLPGCDHSPTLLDYTFLAAVPEPTPSHSAKHRHWNKGNYGAISKGLDRIDWDFELAYLSADSSFKQLASTLHDLADEFIPLKPDQTDTGS